MSTGAALADHPDVRSALLSEHTFFGENWMERTESWDDRPATRQAG